MASAVSAENVCVMAGGSAPLRRICKAAGLKSFKTSALVKGKVNLCFQLLSYSL